MSLRLRHGVAHQVMNQSHDRTGHPGRSSCSCTGKMAKGTRGMHGLGSLRCLSVCLLHCTGGCIREGRNVESLWLLLTFPLLILSTRGNSFLKVHLGGVPKSLSTVPRISSCCGPSETCGRTTGESKTRAQRRKDGRNKPKGLRK